MNKKGQNHRALGNIRSWQVVCKRFLHFTQAIYADTNAEKKNTARVLTNFIDR